ncbi:MAG: type II toxin-antitoxin system HicA family toxin [Saccharofermentans sp.]|nr:type II toxin-antitoxin system HicA family toxin [Saccharofermentans sp.]
MKVSELKKILRKNGCFLVRQGTNHEHWHSILSNKSFMVPRHDSKEIPKGTLEAILKQAGIK